jgi:hypothetical protein
MTKITIEMVGLIDNCVNDCYRRQEVFRCYSVTDRQIVTLAKAIMGWTGVRCRRESLGETIRLHQPNSTLALDISVS